MKPLTDRVIKIEKNSRNTVKGAVIVSERAKKYVEANVLMKKEISSQLSVILEMLTPLRGDSTVQVEDHGVVMESEKEAHAND